MRKYLGLVVGKNGGCRKGVENSVTQGGKGGSAIKCKPEKRHK